MKVHTTWPPSVELQFLHGMCMCRMVQFWIARTGQTRVTSTMPHGSAAIVVSVFGRVEFRQNQRNFRRLNFRVLPRRAAQHQISPKSVPVHKSVFQGITACRKPRYKPKDSKRSNFNRRIQKPAKRIHCMAHSAPGWETDFAVSGNILGAGCVLGKLQVKLEVWNPASSSQSSLT